MYPTLFHPQSRQAILDRIARLSPQSPRLWGQLTVDRAVTHLSDQLRMALGEIKASPARGPLRFAFPRYLAIHVMPWPRGKVKAPGDSFKTLPSDFAADCAQLVRLVDRFGARDPQSAWPQHALFGRLSGRDWGVLSYRHLDHHLTQFSV